MTRKEVVISEAELRRLYEEEGSSQREIAQVFSCSQGTVWKRMQLYGIATRSLAEAQIASKGHAHLRHDFSGDIYEKAYLIGFGRGDLYCLMPHENSQTIVVQCGSTRPEQVELFKNLFASYGHVWIGNPDKRGAVQMAVYLNMTFAFLLDLEDAIPDWILGDDETFLAFLAGYVDAEGHVGTGAKALCRIASYDKNILHQSHAVLLKLGVACPPPWIETPAGYVTADGYSYRQDYWCLNIAAKSSLLLFLDLIDPYLKHAGRRQDMEKARANIKARNLKERERRVDIGEARLYHLYEQDGLTQKQIAELIGCSQGTVSEKMREYGIERRSRQIEIAEVELRRFYKEEGLAQEQIAEILGCGLTTVHRKMRLLGIEPYSRRIDIPEAELRRSHDEEGLTQEEIAQVYGCSATTVRNRMREYGIEPRPRGPSPSVHIHKAE